MDTDTIAVIVNGERRELPASQSVVAVLGYLHLPEDRVAVELDKTLVRKRDWAATEVTNGSQLEIVEFVGGG